MTESSDDDAVRDLSEQALDANSRSGTFDVAAGLARLEYGFVRLVVAEAARLLAGVRVDLARCVADAEDTTRHLDELLPHLERLSAADHDIDTFEKIRATVARFTEDWDGQDHVGRYSPEELAALVEAEVTTAHFVLADLLNKAIAHPAPANGPTASGTPA